MYRFAQRRMAFVAAVAVVVLAVAIFAVFPSVYADPKAGPLCALLLVMAVTILAYLLLRFAAVRAEALLVAISVRKGRIALARIDAVEGLGGSRHLPDPAPALRVQGRGLRSRWQRIPVPHRRGHRKNARDSSALLGVCHLWGGIWRGS